MKLFPEQERVQRDIELTPLINIVFLILIFFMLAGTLTPPDSAAIEAIESSSTSEAPPDDVVVLLSHNGEIDVDGRRVSMANVGDEVLALIKERGSGDADAILRAVAIKADAALPAEQLLAVMSALRQHGIQEVRLLTVERP